ncbi:MAG: TetR/AcrR family transcriptional regulator [Gemmatimonadetes bacterium]|nr:TetR/AcrR family transcriptional regulator [Gemmatimonadota bacterium]
MEDLPGVHPPKQKRSRETFEKLVSAAQDLILERGVAATTVHAIIDRAEVGVGAFYARFDGREALMGYMRERFWSEATGGWDEFLDPARWRHAPASGVITGFVRILVVWNDQHASMQRAYLVDALRHEDRDVLARMAELDNVIADRVTALLFERVDQIGHPKPVTATRLATLQLLATLRSRNLFATEELEEGIGSNALIEELTRAFLSYLEIR